MEQIEYTSLSMRDITEHHTMLEQEHLIDPFLPAARRQEMADTMLERFCKTFLESEVMECK